jgi:hypothetical protein
MDHWVKFFEQVGDIFGGYHTRRDAWGILFDPFDDEIRGVLRGIDGTLQRCVYFQGDDVAGRIAGLAW